MKTSYFNVLRQHKIEGAVSIAVGKPKYVNIHYELKLLAPTWELLGAFKTGKITESEYTTQFNAKLARIDPYTVIKELETITGELEPVLMCHCGTKAFCHRHLVAEWLEKETDQIIEEYGIGIVQREGGKIVR